VERCRRVLTVWAAMFCSAPCAKGVDHLPGLGERLELMAPDAQGRTRGPGAGRMLVALLLGVAFTVAAGPEVALGRRWGVQPLGAMAPALRGGLRPIEADRS
jgi:hypothetical protein